MSTTPLVSTAVGVRWCGLVLSAACLLAMSACSKANLDIALFKGAKTGDLITAVNEATAPYVILNLANGARTTALTVPDIATNAAYAGNLMVFRRVVGSGGNYLLGVFEVTQAQWQVIAPSATQSWTLVDTAVVGSSAVAGNLPAFNLSNDAIVAGLTAFNAGKVVQLELPSDSQWAFACSAGSTGTWSWGNATDRTTLAANALVAETRASATQLGPQAVGGLSPNAWGFYDMHGNIWEWTGSGAGAHIRGGSWHDGAILARTANLVDTTQGVYSDTHHALVGVRLVLRQ